MPSSSLHHTSWVMLALLLAFAVLHSGGASLRQWGVARIGERAWRLIFAALSIPAAVVVVGYFLAHRYDGVRLWDLQAQPWIVPVVWVGTAISFLFLYPATYNLLEIPALLKPQVRLYATGIIRVSRHPQAVGQVLWCATHLLWIGTSFTLVTCAGLIAHHLFAVWNGDRRLHNRFGPAFEELRASTSILPFRAVLDGRQRLVASEFLRPAQLGIVIAVGLFWWSHRFIGVGATAFSRTALGHWLA
ncbi:15-cis-zeta-carotene isomerase protein family [Cyanobium sp. NS01]|nr:15-cis-zeta-carotene isomerase protein family [Cyanobium sp. NS01]